MELTIGWHCSSRREVSHYRSRRRVCMWRSVDYCRSRQTCLSIVSVEGIENRGSNVDGAVEMYDGSTSF